MTEYQLALYFWSAVLVAALSAPFALALVNWALSKFGHGDASHDSEPSLPSIPSYPSSPA